MLNRKSVCTGRADLWSAGSTYQKTHRGCDILHHLVCRHVSVGEETQGIELNTSSVSLSLTKREQCSQQFHNTVSTEFYWPPWVWCGGRTLTHRNLKIWTIYYESCLPSLMPLKDTEKTKCFINLLTFNVQTSLYIFISCINLNLL